MSILTKSIDYKYEKIDDLSDYYDSVLTNLVGEAKLLVHDRWVFMGNKKVYYDNKVVGIFPDLRYYECEFYENYSGFSLDKVIPKMTFEGFKGTFMSKSENKKAFNRYEKYPQKSSQYRVLFNNSRTSKYICFCNKDKNMLQVDVGSRDNEYDNVCNKPGLIIPIYRLNGKNSESVNSNKVLNLWLENGLIPKDTAYDKEYELLIKMCKNTKLVEEADTLKVDRKILREAIKNNKIQLNFTYSSENMSKELLNCDKERADIESYDVKMLIDPNRGHWDIWSDAQPKDTLKVKLNREIIARNPIADIKEGGVVGIDFGTKSTVVVNQEDSEYTLPMRVGIGQYKKAIDEKHYENPTVMEFINLKDFLNSYKLSEGRPNTKWRDLTISHSAFNSLINSNSDNYYAYFSELKQWCGNKDKRIRIKDKNNNVFNLPTFLELNENEFNPVEIYAYYLGLYINNLHNGIYLDYILSFPVTYEKKVREKIISSFEKGLKKSLPPQLHNNEEVMSKFRVSIGASEPAAYALCALQEYGFEPEEDDKIFYGVFDFGGGTTDFDFGIYREATGRRERKYDFVIEHFGAGGDRYLGGENLLELLAFEVFKSNADSLREFEITFMLPPECKKFPGSEVLLSESQEARLNMRQAMEKLRPLWEKHKDYEKLYQKGAIGVNLFKNDGSMITNCQIKLDIKKLENILTERIGKGIKNFFESLRIAFNNSEASSIEMINIFLAGNSSKSPIVRDLFDEYIKKETELMLGNIESLDCASTDEVALTIDNNIFEIYPPLGTEEAYKKQEEIGLEVERDNIKKPTGKTGVAFGLVESRPGGAVKVIDKNSETDEAKFRYYIGENKRKKFRPIINTETKYDVWYEFVDAFEEDFEIYYSSLPEASTGKMPISEASRLKCRLKETFEDEDVFVYIKALSPTVIEYVVAREDDINNGVYLSKITKMQLK